MAKVELHSHVFPSSCDSHMTAEQLVLAAIEKGLHGIVVSSHFDVISVSHLQEEEQRLCSWNCSDCSYHKRDMHYAPELHAELYRRWCEAIRETQEIGDKYGLKVYAGCEYSLADHITHIGILGFTYEELLEACLLPEQPMSYLQGLHVKYPHLLFVNNHPNRNRCNWTTPKVDAYERYNTKHSERWLIDSIEHVRSACSGSIPSDVIYVCGADAHDTFDLGVSYMDFEYLPADEHELVAEIRKHNYTIHIEV